MATEFKASHRYIRITSRKLGLLADAVRGKGINEALAYLNLSTRSRTAGVVVGVLKSAAASADRKGTVDVDSLFVREILVGQGPTLKRFRPRAKGSAYPIMKRCSHLFVTLAEK